MTMQSATEGARSQLTGVAPTTPRRAPERSALRGVSQRLRDEGLRAALDKVSVRVRAFLYLNETHVWSELAIGPELTVRPLDDGLSLVRGDTSDAHSAVTVPNTLSPGAAERRLARGAEMWVVKAGGETAFVCWIFRDASPVIASKGGSYPLPPGTAMLEDSATSPDFRGRGIAPAAWSQIAQELRAAGFDRLITKVEIHNAPSRKAVVKAGFVESAALHLRRIGGRNFVRVETLAGPRMAGELESRTG